MADRVIGLCIKSDFIVKILMERKSIDNDDIYFVDYMCKSIPTRVNEQYEVLKDIFSMITKAECGSDILLVDKRTLSNYNQWIQGLSQKEGLSVFHINVNMIEPIIDTPAKFAEKYPEESLNTIDRRTNAVYHELVVITNLVENYFKMVDDDNKAIVQHYVK